MTTVLLVEANRMLRTMVAAGMSGYGYDVYEVSNMKAAMQLLEDGLCPSVLVTNWNLPDGNAESLILAVQGVASADDLRVIVATGQPEQVTCHVDYIMPRNVGVMDILTLL